MKVCIITVYNSLNYGSFLQAFALSEVLKEMGHKVSFLETKARNPLAQTLKSTTKKIINFDYDGAKLNIEKYIKFKNANKKFNICKKKIDELDKQDVFIFGSDEIWNISREDFSKYPIFLGKGLPKKFFMSYAPSINTSTYQMIKENSYFIECINNIDKISVRDKHSLCTLQQVTSKDIDIVLDPTLLLDKDKYNSLEEKCDDKNYILVYSYGHNMTEERIKKIREFANVKEMKLISVGFDLKWCDKSISASPFLFLSYIKNAAYVITDTFHGTVFSIIYNKSFVTYGGSNTKIREITNQFGISERNINNEDSLESAFSNNMEYRKINSFIEKYKNDSLKYIYDSFESIKEKKDENIT